MRHMKKVYGAIILLLLVVIGIGYAALSATLNITGQSKIEKATWDVHFENVNITSGSVTAVKDATIDSNTTNLSYEIQLAKPGDFYEFTVDIKNAGSIDAMVSEVLKTGLTQEQTKYLSYNLSYGDGTDITVKDKLSSGDAETVIVRIEFKKDITADQLPSVDQNLTLSLNMTYVQADNTAVVIPKSFATDSWDTIATNVRAGRITPYKLGDTKEVDMGELGTHTVRVANTTTPAECSTDGFSQTACGFVVEFSDIITTHAMNSTSTNIGGWPVSEMRRYIEDTIYLALPGELQSGIVDTNVVSGYGREDTDNFVSIDKLYLLSTKEVWGKEGTTNLVNYDTAEVQTRQLDYYKSIGSTTSSSSGAIKKNGNTKYYWWLRSPIFSGSDSFYSVNADSGWSHYGSEYTFGVSPAFRIG